MEIRGESYLLIALHCLHSPLPARLLSKLHSEEAQHAWRALIEQNPDCYHYYRGYLSNQGVDLGVFLCLPKPSTPISTPIDAVTDQNRSEALATLREFSSLIPRAAAPRRLALDIAQG